MTTARAARTDAPVNHLLMPAEQDDYRDLIHDALILLRAQKSSGWMHYARCAARLRSAGHQPEHELTVLLYGLLQSRRIDDLELLLLGYPIMEVDRARTLGLLLAQPSIHDTCDLARSLPPIEARALMSVALVILVEHLLHEPAAERPLTGGMLRTAIGRMVTEVETTAGLTGLAEFIERIQLLEPLPDVRLHAWVDAHLFQVRE